MELQEYNFDNDPFMGRDIPPEVPQMLIDHGIIYLDPEAILKITRDAAETSFESKDIDWGSMPLHEMRTFVDSYAETGRARLEGMENLFTSIVNNLGSKLETEKDELEFAHFLAVMIDDLRVEHTERIAVDLIRGMIDLMGPETGSNPTGSFDN